MFTVFRIDVDGETFDVTSQFDSVHFSWVSGPNPDYGFSSSRSDGSLPTESEAKSMARAFLTSIDPSTGYIAD